MQLAGEKTGSVSGPPPPVSSEVTDDIVSSSKEDPKGLNAPAQDDEEAGEKTKSSSKDGSGGTGACFTFWLKELC